MGIVLVVILVGSDHQRCLLRIQDRARLEVALSHQLAVQIDAHRLSIVTAGNVMPLTQIHRLISLEISHHSIAIVTTDTRHGDAGCSFTSPH